MLTLTPQARAVAAFALAVALLTSQLNRVTIAVLILFGNSYPHGRSGAFLTGLLLVAVGGAVVLFAMTAAKGLAGSKGWESSLAQAAILVAMVGLGINAVEAVGAVLHNDSGGLFGVLGATYAG
jgi:hypothetical protein